MHFAPLTPEETLEESIVRHQRLMIKRLELQAGMRVVDVGCGVGGPMRRVASEAGVRVVCINNNEQQLAKTRQRNVEAGLDHMAEYMKCNFMDMSAIEANSFDAGYAIESTCHAPDKKRAFAEIFRVLKPGALFWGQGMCMTEKFDRGWQLADMVATGPHRACVGTRLLYRSTRFARLVVVHGRNNSQTSCGHEAVGHDIDNFPCLGRPLGYGAYAFQNGQNRRGDFAAKGRSRETPQIQVAAFQRLIPRRLGVGVKGAVTRLDKFETDCPQAVVYLRE